jgi:hypothetical protein
MTHAEVRDWLRSVGVPRAKVPQAGKTVIVVQPNGRLWRIAPLQVTGAYTVEPLTPAPGERVQ